MRKAAIGTISDHRISIAVGFPKRLFDKISALAQENDRSFANQVVRLCEKALKDE